MGFGISGGILWALDTVILGIALTLTPFVSSEQAIFLAPFVSTFLHDAFSSVWMLLYTGVTRQFANVWRALKTRSGKFIMLGALLGGPVGMSGYVAAIHFIGPGMTAVISSMYPALGALLSYFFLKEKMKPTQIIGLLLSIGGVIAMGYSSADSEISNLPLGFLCAVLCCVGWASEAVICAYGMKDPFVGSNHALQIRQVTSALVYGLILLPVLGGWSFTASVFPTGAAGLIALSALCGTASYLCYYRAISQIGPPKAMALNITYSAWSLVFSLLFLHTLPDGKSLLCALVILCGAFLAVIEKKPGKQAQKEPSSST